jgi:hypothetical protein
MMRRTLLLWERATSCSSCHHAVDLRTERDLHYSLPRHQTLQTSTQVADVLNHQAFEMAFIHNNHMVEHFPAAIANPTLCHAVLRRTSITGPLGVYAEVLHGLNHVAIEVRAAIKYQVSGRKIKREASRNC